MSLLVKSRRTNLHNKVPWGCCYAGYTSTSRYGEGMKRKDQSNARRTPGHGAEPGYNTEFSGAYCCAVCVLAERTGQLGR